MNGVAEAWRSRAPLTWDALTALALAAVPVLLVLPQERHLTGGTWALWLLIVAIAGLALAFRRRAPLVAVAVSAVATTSAAVLSGTDVTSPVTLVAIVSAAYRIRRGHLWLALGALVWFTAHAVLGGIGVDPLGLMMVVLIPLASVALGYALRLRTDRAADAVRLERARAATARADERTRIARDVHDVVGHHLSAIRLQAVGGRRRLATAPGDADRVLETIADLAVRALGDIRDLLERLRETATDEHGLADLRELAERLGGDELRITVTTSVHREIAPPVESCVYRLVQEALTNVARHSRARWAAVRVDGEAETLAVSVDDPGPARGERTSGGAGLRGMRDRVLDQGGSFEAGPHGTRGWRVRAELPVGTP
ncbi:sensor histidine kinase [Pseudonocardia sp. TRM90224]|uniref:sensor histidine kinase n=1 Tax=Pseudonocardia sp. TRM90224 TaxID=2812678 RepID=UPI001E311022|nr:histidine kinase [Pseudonocardia sp. TRM90224]